VTDGRGRVKQDQARALAPVRAPRLKRDDELRRIVRARVKAALRALPDAAEAQTARDWLSAVTPGGSHFVGRGRVGTGELAHEWAHLLRDECERHEVRVDFSQLPPHGRALMRALGVRPL
jgi:hypothetical protein